MGINLSCMALNVRGLNNERKRRQVFRWLHRRKFQIIFLQEVYSLRDIEKIWSAEWGGKVVFCHGTKHSCGTIVLFHSWCGTCWGRQEGQRNCSVCFTFIKTQVKFFESLKLRIRKFADENIIIGGNLNCCLTRKDKKRGRPTEQKKQLIDSILSLTNSINLVDLWRKFHPNESLFTWHHQSSAIQCRVDCWLVSKHLLLHVKECNIIPVSFSEHSAVSFNIQSDDFIKRGPGFFQFNKSIPWWSVFRQGFEWKKLASTNKNKTI